MTLTVVVGSSGSGKTTFLNDVHKKNKCTYIRQYHNLRPYIKVRSIPRFDPTALPYWAIYEKENPNIPVGGTMAGEFTAGLSGGQRKLLLFEMIYQRTKDHSDLLICLDEPFAGVTDDFVPFITSRLNDMRLRHNILLVTNDHVQTLTGMADNTITVSALDRSKVQIDGSAFGREVALLAVSSGKDYEHGASSHDLKFFLDVEITANAGLGGVAGFTVFAMSMFVLSYWDSKPGSEALVIVALQIIAYFCINPYLLQLVDWKNYMTEEAEALMHASVGMNKAMKSTLTLIILLVITCIAFGVLNGVIDTMGASKFFAAMLFDSASLTLPFICFGLYTDLPFQAVQILSSMPFLMMIFFSTTFSPGAGVQGVKVLRYLFARFYFWCMVPGYMEAMEGCPEGDDALVAYTVLSGCLGLGLFLVVMGVRSVLRSRDAKSSIAERSAVEQSDEFKRLQAIVFRGSTGTTGTTGTNGDGGGSSNKSKVHPHKQV